MNRISPKIHNPNPSLKVMGARLRSSIQLLSAVSNISTLPVRVKDLSQAAEEILTTLVQELEEVDSCSLLLYNPKQESLSLIAASGQADLMGESRGGYNKDLRFAPGEGIAGTVFIENSPRFWNREAAGAELVPVDSAASVPESLACMPLTASTERIGVLNVSFVRSKPFDYYRKRDLLLLAGVAANVIQAFLLRLEVNKFARLLKEERERAKPVIETVPLIRKENENGNGKLNLVIQSCPSPVIAWKKRGEEFFLADCNAEGKKLVEREVGHISPIAAERTGEMGQAMLPSIYRCYNDRSSFTEEIAFQARDSAGERRFLTSYAYVPPDSIYSFLIDLGRNGSSTPASGSDEEKLTEMVHQRVSRLEIINRDLVSRLAEKDRLVEDLEEKAAAEKSQAEGNNLRMKKNLEVVNSLLSLISNRADDEYIATVLTESQRQISSIALIYETIHQTKDAFYIDLRSYVKKLVAKLRSMYVPQDQYIDFKIRCNDISVPVKSAIPVCLIISELTSNSIRHAFPDKRDGRVTIGLEAMEQGEIRLRLEDDGVGFGEEIDLDKVESPGLSLAVGLARKQLGGTIRLDQGKGTGFEIVFSV